MNRKETEAYVLGMILIKEDFLKTYTIDPGIFHHEPYRIIASALSKIILSPENFNTRTLINYLTMTDELEKVGGIEEIVALQINLPNRRTREVLSKALNLLETSDGDFELPYEAAINFQDLSTPIHGMPIRDFRDLNYLDVEFNKFMTMVYLLSSPEEAKYIEEEMTKVIARGKTADIDLRCVYYPLFMMKMINKESNSPVSNPQAGSEERIKLALSKLKNMLESPLKEVSDRDQSLTGSPKDKQRRIAALLAIRKLIMLLGDLEEIDYLNKKIDALQQLIQTKAIEEEHVYKPMYLIQLITTQDLPIEIMKSLNNLIKMFRGYDGDK